MEQDGGSGKGEIKDSRLSSNSLISIKVSPVGPWVVETALLEHRPVDVGSIWILSEGGDLLSLGLDGVPTFVGAEQDETVVAAVSFYAAESDVLLRFEDAAGNVSCSSPAALGIAEDELMTEKLSDVVAVEPFSDIADLVLLEVVLDVGKEGGNDPIVGGEHVQAIGEFELARGEIGLGGEFAFNELGGQVEATGELTGKFGSGVSGR